HQRPAAADLESLDGLRFRSHHDRELRELPLELVGSLLTLARAFGLTRSRSSRRCFTEGGPRARRAPAFLVALGKIQERANPGVDALALFQFGASLLVALAFHELERLVEQRFGCCLVAHRALRSSSTRAKRQTRHDGASNNPP